MPFLFFMCINLNFQFSIIQFNISKVGKFPFSTQSICFIIFIVVIPIILIISILRRLSKIHFLLLIGLCIAPLLLHVLLVFSCGLIIIKLKISGVLVLVIVVVAVLLVVETTIVARSSLRHFTNIVVAVIIISLPSIIILCLVSNILFLIALVIVLLPVSIALSILDHLAVSIHAVFVWELVIVSHGFIVVCLVLEVFLSGFDGLAA